MVMTVQSYRKASGSSTAYYDAVVADGATAYWDLNESSGNFADSINGHTMTVNGATHGASAIMTTDGGSAATFDGTNDYLNASTHADLFPAPGQSFTIEAWIRPPSGAQFGPAVAMRDPGSPFEQFFLGVGYLNSSGSYTSSRHIGFYLADPLTRRRSYRTTSEIIPASGDPTPFYIVGVYDNAANTAKIYVDGTEESTTLAYSAGAYPDGAAGGGLDLEIGRIYTEYYEGDIDSVAVYDHVVLSSAQVSDHYTKGT